MADAITEADLLAYVDDQIDTARRVEIEDYLAKHPDAAAQVMADLRTRDALRLAGAAELPRPSMKMVEAACRLERTLARRRILGVLQRAAAVVALVSLGWWSHAQIGLFEITDSVASPKPPIFVEDAFHSHETALLRARIGAPAATTGQDLGKILAETGIRLPALPAEWRIADLQVFPSRSGHSVEVAVEAGRLGRLSLFAARAGTFAVITPTVARSERATAVYWQTGTNVYALTGEAPEAGLQREAVKLADSLL